MGAYGPPCPFTLPREGRSPLRPLIFADREDAVPPNPPSGRGTVLCAHQILRTARTRSLPLHHSGGAQSPVAVFFNAGRGTVPGARFCERREGHSPLCHRQDCLCHSAERKRTLWEGHGPLCPRIFADRGDAVPPIRPSGRGTVLCARLPYPREGRSPLRPLILADGGDAVPPHLAMRWGALRFGGSPGGAQSPAPVNSCGRRGRRPSQRSI